VLQLLSHRGGSVVIILSLSSTISRPVIARLFPFLYIKGVPLIEGSGCVGENSCLLASFFVLLSKEILGAFRK
jgi:hypothetical protein